MENALCFQRSEAPCTTRPPKKKLSRTLFSFRLQLTWNLKGGGGGPGFDYFLLKAPGPVPQFPAVTLLGRSGTRKKEKKKSTAQRPEAEALVVVDAVELRHVAVHPGHGAREDLELLARVVAHHPDLGAHFEA